MRALVAPATLAARPVHLLDVLVDVADEHVLELVAPPGGDPTDGVVDLGGAEEIDVVSGGLAASEVECVGQMGLLAGHNLDTG